MTGAGDATGRAMVELDGIRKTFGPLVAIDGLSMRILPGEFVTLLGPSGSGKTTCLRIIAGMVRPDRGRLVVAGRDVSAMPMHKRNIGMVFQNYSLFPHLTVAQNVAYPLRVRGVPGSEAGRRVAAALEMVRLPGIGGRRPDQLSGGQQQRVALARALVFDPDVLLLDEPLSALDRVLREEMQVELRRVHRETGKTMVCVTHDRSEALGMADRIVVMRDGRVVQDGAPREVYERPGSRFVANFLGETNCIPMVLTRSGGRAEARDEAGRLLVFDGLSGAVPEGAVDCVVRVENLGLAPVAAGTSSAPGGATWTGVVTEATFLGEAVRYTIRCDPHTLTGRVPLPLARDVVVGTEVSIDIAAARPALFPATAVTRGLHDGV